MPTSTQLETNPDAFLGTPTIAGTEIAGADQPSFKSRQYEEMSSRWQICRDLMVGTEALRANSKSYLPQHPAEDDDEYQLRVMRAECFPGFQHSVKGLVGIVFRDDPQLQDDVPPDIRNDHYENIDGAGSHGTIFLKNCFEEMMTVGHTIVLVDMPRAPSLGRPLTLAEERQAGIRPVWIRISPEQVYSWRIRIVAGVVTLTQIVIHEQATVPAGDFGDTVISRYRVLRYDPDTGVVSFQIWEEREGAFYADIIDEGTIVGVNRIPIGVGYGGMRRGPLSSMPPLLDLAYANIAHVQVLTDHRYALYLASVPLLVFKGRPPAQRQDSQGNPIRTPVGPNVAIDVSSDGDVKYVEHSGAALGQTRSELKDLEMRMAALGLSMLQAETRAAETAEAKRIDKSEKDATISTAARSLIDLAETLLDFHSQFLGNAPGTGGSVFIDLEFEVESMDSAMISAYSAAVAAGQLSLQTMWEIMRNRGALPADFDEDLEQERISAMNMAATPIDEPPAEDDVQDQPPPPNTAS